MKVLKQYSDTAENKKQILSTSYWSWHNTWHISLDVCIDCFFVLRLWFSVVYQLWLYKESSVSKIYGKGFYPNITGTSEKPIMGNKECSDVEEKKIQPGNSGGPLISNRGLIYGIVQSKLNAIWLAQFTRDIAKNINFAVKKESAIQILQQNGIEYSTQQSAEKSKMDIPDIADEATQYTVQVMCHG